ncbi:hypothetical protein BKA65DRAFT_92768 [Rhexocercosporidium sp. MPI-PUGE-AT-0058]|nr:hypothetical protein BKA65DRAFT_92768 [Rhexocercosporidium sp. MPI-PUGE-AT-0058]
MQHFLIYYSSLTLIPSTHPTLSFELTASPLLQKASISSQLNGTQPVPSPVQDTTLHPPLSSSSYSLSSSTPSFLANHTHPNPSHHTVASSLAPQHQRHKTLFTCIDVADTHPSTHPQPHNQSSVWHCRDEPETRPWRSSLSGCQVVNRIIMSIIIPEQER